MRRKAVGAGFTGLTGAAALLVVGMLALILFDVVRGGAGRLSWEFLTAAPSNGMMSGGIFPAIYGTAVMTLLMTLAVMPVGVMTAIYLHEYAPPDSRLATLVRVAVTNLAGVPSIVFGLFGLGFFIQFVGRGLDRAFSEAGDLHYGQPALVWAALTLAVLTLPVVIVATESSSPASRTSCPTVRPRPSRSSCTSATTRTSSRRSRRTSRRLARCSTGPSSSCSSSHSP